MKQLIKINLILLLTVPSAFACLRSIFWNYHLWLRIAKLFIYNECRVMYMVVDCCYKFIML